MTASASTGNGAALLLAVVRAATAISSVAICGAGVGSAVGCGGGWTAAGWRGAGGAARWPADGGGAVGPPDVGAGVCVSAWVTFFVLQAPSARRAMASSTAAMNSGVYAFWSTGT